MQRWILLPFLWLVACSEQPEYVMPAAFPVAETQLSCPELEGSYRNLGVQQDGKEVFLSNVLGPFNQAFEKAEDRALAYRRVSLMNAIYVDFYHHKNGAMDVTLKAVDRDLILHPLPGKGQELVCQKGWLALVSKDSKVPFGLGKTKISFARAEEGGLLVKRQDENVIEKSLKAGAAEKALAWYYFPEHR